ncbi:hypothetical protein [Pseudaminobacter soli (ex Li et al. 2025)]|uniref:Uncharacterized protein n=1 Tax=Pseudaminobacter soli (ex Li et al. 2025) TaxID=1295366 RepID=A0A2P7SGH0_9HYPH|nr:hypothetical protein [Mesorhizobium soli]PSJ61570.1 hypothetical protein C7I85_11040 [Mesorhizobium soli]
MPLQNRVDPFGEIQAVAARGLFTGNRGVIHDPDTKTLLRRRWSTRAWLICVCEFRGRHREVMGRNAPSGGAGWTELFFLDEVTGLAAGHRPCFYCRRQRAQDFAARFGATFAIDEPKVYDIDSRLHAERLASGGQRIRLGQSELAALPDGAMVAQGGDAFAIKGGKMWRWSFGGYQSSPGLADGAGGEFSLLTPPTTIAVLRAGYEPAWHPSIET